ncbi:LD-carboxypeptidase [Ottowia testudinis]|uniref:LD-carboxypeptidase n=1 Tax=Ottowia testudinis TaxID=2816950 RepID=A0A975H4S3_9BURK|nr:LD-carboxypeptidase [Ottowia testudinis]QTD47164.1 LD-carboxypeptidase [Ottowia testudinis]
MPHIYIYSPSGAVRDKAAFRRGIKRLQAMGHEVEIDSAALAGVQRFAGDDATRLAAIGRAAASGADVALISRGGYGISRLLPDLPYRPLARAVDKGTRFVGLSDFTALQLALLAKTGAVTWAGPALCEGFGAADAGDAAEGHGGKPMASGPDEIMLACFDDLVSGVGEGTGWRLPAADIAALGGKTGTLAHAAPLWGGNLAMVVSLLGTPFFPETKGGVLFLEDVGEHPYRIERMLTQLLHAGVLTRQKAIVLGQFTEYKLTPHDRGYTLARVVAWLRAQVKVPVLTGLPFGHVPTKVLLPVGAKIDLLVEERDALVLWGHAH